MFYSGTGSKFEHRGSEKCGPWQGGIRGGYLNPLLPNLKRRDLKGRRIPYAPRLPPTLIRLLRINAHRIISLLAFAIPSKAGRAQRSRGQRDQRALRALRALWAEGPFGPLGPAYTQRKVIPYRYLSVPCTLYAVPFTLAETGPRLSRNLIEKSILGWFWGTW